MLEKITIEQFYTNIDDFLVSSVSKTWYWIHSQTSVNYGYKNDCNIEWCKENNIPVYNAKRGAGCIVSAPGNISLVDIRPFDGHTWLAHNILKDFTDYLISLGLNAFYSHNDVMISGYKVASGVNTNLKPSYKMQYTGIQFSINQNYEVIEGACLKKMIKLPGKLSDFGIGTEEVENWIITKF